MADEPTGTGWKSRESAEPPQDDSAAGAATLPPGEPEVDDAAGAIESVVPGSEEDLPPTVSPS